MNDFASVLNSKWFGLGVMGFIVLWIGGFICVKRWGLVGRENVTRARIDVAPTWSPMVSHEVVV